MWFEGVKVHTERVRIHTHLLDEVLHFVLQPPPLEFDGDQFVRTHVGAVFLGMELLLQTQQQARRDQRC